MTKFAILGYGFMGKKHCEAISAHPNTQVTAIIDHIPPNVPDVAFFQHLELFLEARPQVDVIIIATPNYDHFSSAKKLLEAGYNIFLEKPYCLKTSESKILMALAEGKQKHIFFARQNRASHTAKFLKKTVEAGVLGNIFMIQTNLFWARDERYYTLGSWKGTKAKDGGILFTQFFHFIDLILWIFGDFNVLNSTIKQLKHKNIIEIEDTGSFTFELKNKGGIGVINFSTALYEKNYESSMTIIAEHGTLKISGQYFDEIEYCNISNFDLNKNSLKKSDNLSNLKEMLDDICQNLKMQKFEDIHAGFRVVKTIEDIYQEASRMPNKTVTQ